MRRIKAFITSLLVSLALISPTIVRADLAVLSISGNPRTATTTPYLVLSSLNGQSACSITVGGSFGGTLSVEGLYKNTTNSQWTDPLTVYTPDGTTITGTVISSAGSYIFNCGGMTAVRADGSSASGTPAVVLNASGGVNVIAHQPGGGGGGGVSSVSGTGNIASTGGTTPVISITNSPTFTGNATVGNLTDTALTSGRCVQTTTGGLLTVTGAACSSGTGTVTAVTGSGNIASSGGTTPNITISNSPTFSGTVTAGTNLIDSALSAGLCVQTSTAGLLSTAAGACGTGTVTSVNAGSNTSITGTATDPIVNVVNAPVFPGQVTANSFRASNLTSGDCLESVLGVIQSAGASCPSGAIGGVTAGSNIVVTPTNPNSPTVAVTSSPTFSGTLTAGNIFDSSLTAGRCIQTGTSGLLTVTSTACGSGTGTVTAVTGTGNIVSTGGTTPNITIIDSPIFTGSVRAGILEGGNLVTGQCISNTTASHQLISSGENCPVSYRDGARITTGPHIEIFHNATITNGSTGIYPFGAGYPASNPPYCVASPSAAGTAAISTGLWVSAVSITSVSITNGTGVSQTPYVTCTGIQ